MATQRWARRRALWHGGLIALSAFGLALPGGAAMAQQAFPTKPVRIVVGNAPGGGTDTAARLLAQQLSTLWGQPVVVENKPGASGIVGADLVAKAAPDGHTLLLSPQTSTAMAASMVRQLPYDVLRDFRIVTVVGSVPTVLVVAPSMPAKNLQEFSAYAKANADKLSFGSGGIGSTQHLAGEMLNLALDVKMAHVPYKGESPALVDVMSGVLPLTFATLTSAMPHVRSGKLRALGVASLQRSAAAPELPTLAEAGLPGFEIAPWYGLFGPAALPRELVQRIHADVAKVLALPELKAQFLQQGFDLDGRSPDEAAAYLRAEIAKYAKLVKAANLQMP